MSMGIAFVGSLVITVLIVQSIILRRISRSIRSLNISFIEYKAEKDASKTKNMSYMNDWLKKGQNWLKEERV